MGVDAAWGGGIWLSGEVFALSVVVFELSESPEVFIDSDSGF